jgi:hypothetical protein
MLDGMTRLKIKLISSGLTCLVAVLLTSGVAEARLIGNHNDTILRSR